jgi:hypothetical protein
MPKPRFSNMPKWLVIIGTDRDKRGCFCHFFLQSVKGGFVGKSRLNKARNPRQAIEGRDFLGEVVEILSAGNRL